MSEPSAPEKKRGKGRIAAILIMAASILGAGSGVTSYIVFTGPSEASTTISGEQPVTSSRAELPLGRIAINLRQQEGRSSRASHMVIDMVLEYDPGQDVAAPEGSTTDAMTARHARLRDSFIEYLTQLSEAEVAGSSGLSAMRGELLRRARVVAGNDSPKALLIQDYILQ